MRGSRAKARSPITPLLPKSKSSTGVKLKSTPQARNSEANTKPQAVAAFMACKAPLPTTPFSSSFHKAPKERMGGKWVKPSVLKRCTRPPSWSTQIKASGRTDLMSAHKALSCARSTQLRPNKIKPPVSGCAKRRRSVSLSAVPAMSKISGAWATGFMGQAVVCSTMTWLVA